MEPMEFYVLSVYKFEFFQRLSTGSSGFLGARVCTEMFILSKHIGVKHACSWGLIRERGQAVVCSGSQTLHISIAL